MPQEPPQARGHDGYEEHNDTTTTASSTRHALSKKSKISSIRSSFMVNSEPFALTATNPDHSIHVLTESTKPSLWPELFAVAAADPDHRIDVLTEGA